MLFVDDFSRGYRFLVVCVAPVATNRILATGGCFFAKLFSILDFFGIIHLVAAAALATTAAATAAAAAATAATTTTTTTTTIASFPTISAFRATTAGE